MKKLFIFLLITLIAINFTACKKEAEVPPVYTVDINLRRVTTFRSVANFPINEASISLESLSNDRKWSGITESIEWGAERYFMARFANVPAGRYNIVVTHQDLHTHTESIDIHGDMTIDNNTHKNIRVSPILFIFTVSTSSTVGSSRNTINALAKLEHINGFPTFQATTSGEFGIPRVTFFDVPEGRYNLIITHPNFRTYAENIYIDRDFADYIVLEHR